mmetsp:Transcript_35504/g.103997  ORF Transcript_35504/g.103997 Transcript_35504/m.103997 type:complete len:281 (+) Transcript_35504:702-1544(+)|eukprot:4321302-Prymnesium_polylepis.1
MLRAPVCVTDAAADAHPGCVARLPQFGGDHPARKLDGCAAVSECERAVRGGARPGLAVVAGRVAEHGTARRRHSDHDQRPQARREGPERLTAASAYLPLRSGGEQRRTSRRWRCVRCLAAADGDDTEAAAAQYQLCGRRPRRAAGAVQQELPRAPDERGWALRAGAWCVRICQPLAAAAAGRPLVWLEPGRGHPDCDARVAARHELACGHLRAPRGARGSDATTNAAARQDRTATASERGQSADGGCGRVRTTRKPVKAMVLHAGGCALAALGPAANPRS